MVISVMGLKGDSCWSLKEVSEWEIYAPEAQCQKFFFHDTASEAYTLRVATYQTLPTAADLNRIHFV